MLVFKFISNLLCVHLKKCAVLKQHFCRSILQDLAFKIHAVVSKCAHWLLYCNNVELALYTAVAPMSHVTKGHFQ